MSVLIIDVYNACRFKCASMKKCAVLLLQKSLGLVPYGVDDSVGGRVRADTGVGVTAESSLYDPLEDSYRSQRQGVAVSYFESCDIFFCVLLCVYCMYEFFFVIVSVCAGEINGPGGLWCRCCECQRSC